MVEIVEHFEGGVRVAALIGKLDAEAVPIFEEWSSRRFNAPEKRIILDFNGLVYLSSAGLRSILTLNRHAEHIGGTLLFCGLGGMVRQIFQVSGLIPHLSIFPGVKEALASP